MRVLRVYHSGRDPGHRRRERALLRAGIDVRLVVPRHWPSPGSELDLTGEDFEVIELDVTRAPDVNRHRYTAPAAMSEVLRRVRPDVLDIHEEPYSVAARQWLEAAGDIPVVMYTAQNLDKRYPPPFAQFESRAFRRVAGLYPCSRQAASVARGKGFGRTVSVLPLGVEPSDFSAGDQRHDHDPFVIGLVGRLVREKGPRDAVRVLAGLRDVRDSRLLIVGEGPDREPALELAESLGVRASVDVRGWSGTADIADAYRSMHVLLVPSQATATWVEQFGRVIVEAQASGCVVAAYDSGAISEVCGTSGVVVPERDVAGLTAAVRDLASDPGRWAQLRADGLRRSSEFTWTSVAHGQKALYERVMEELAGAGDAGLETVPATRHAAREEFGMPARTAAGERPIAVPGLRTIPALNDVTGRLIDLTAAGLRRVHVAR